MATRIIPSQNKRYYINPSTLTFIENSGYGVQMIQVSASSSCYISVYDPDNGILATGDSGIRKWKVIAYNNKFPDNDRDPWNIYIRLERNGPSGLVVYDKKERAVNGGIVSDSTTGDPDPAYYYIKIGTVGATDGVSVIRKIIYDTGFLDTFEANQMVGESLSAMFVPHYEDPENPSHISWIEAKAHLGVCGSVTMDVDNGDMDLPTLWDSLPVDGTTITKGPGGELMVNPDINFGGGLDKKELEEYLTEHEYAVKSEIPTLLSQLEDDILSGNYIPVTGGTASGGINATSFVATSGYFTANNGWFQNKLSGQGMYNVAGDARWFFDGTLKGWKSDKEIFVGQSKVYHAGNLVSLKNPSSLTFGDKSYDGGSDVELKAEDIGAITSHQTIYSLTIKNSEGTTLLTYTPNGHVGSITLTKAMVGLGNVENTKLSTWKGSSSLTTLGTVTDGTWNGSKIANAYLANSSVSIAGISVTLGGSITVAALQESLGLGALAYKASLTAADIPSLDWSKIKTGKPTTLAGYGITDAKIANGVITLGSSTITPLTSHQAIYNLTMQAGKFAAVTFDPNGAAKTVNIPTTTSHISEGDNLYYTDARARAAITGGASTVTSSNLTASRVLVSNASGKVAVSAVTSTELGYLDGVTSSVQTQLDGKVAISGAQTVTGEKNFTGGLKVNGGLVGYSSEENMWALPGNLFLEGELTMSSQRSLKNIVDQDGLTLDELTVIKPTRFTWKDGRDDKVHAGGIADDVMTVLPEVVRPLKDGTLTMDYGSAAFMTAASLIQHVDENRKRIEDLENTIMELLTEIKRLKEGNV